MAPADELERHVPSGPPQREGEACRGLGRFVLLADVDQRPQRERPELRCQRANVADRAVRRDRCERGAPEGTGTVLKEVPGPALGGPERAEVVERDVDGAVRALGQAAD